MTDQTTRDRRERAQQREEERRRQRARAAMPDDVTPYLSLFDRFATIVNRFVSRAWFFAGCLLLVVIWAPSYFLIGDVDTWQLIINTATTIVTFLLVALLQNTQTRSDNALQHKLNGIAKALADLMVALSDQYPTLARDESELRAAVGLEDREGS
jgi:low affinity Fe/Cu permease